MGGVPEYWGKKSPYTDGTTFLGTPANHDELVKKRPLSPDVMDINGKTHYKFQPNAISSIVNRVTGVGLSVGFAALGAASLAGLGPDAVALVKGLPVLLYPAKGAVSFMLVYHYLGALRHFAWDYGKIGKQVESNDLLALDKVQLSSKLLLGVSGVAALGLTVYSV